MKKIFLSIVVILSNPVVAQEPNDMIDHNKMKNNFSKCVVVTSWIFQGRNADEIDGSDRVVKIPEGWQVIGAGSVNNQPVFYICK